MAESILGLMQNLYRANTVCYVFKRYPLIDVLIDSHNLLQFQYRKIL